MSTANGSTCPTFTIEYASVSDMGMRRANNQDALASIVTEDVSTWAERGHLFLVADGMGAHAAGELASKLAVGHIPHTYFKRRDLYPPAALRQAIRDANEAIHTKGQSAIGFQGMGTTCSCLALLPQGALVAHIGDSRVYRQRGNVLEQLTFDHSLVWEMAAAGHMAQEDVPAYIPKNVITRSLGPHPVVQVDLEGPYNVQAGDVFLLCSDGLSGPVTDEEIGVLLQCLPPQEAAEALVDFANLRGGPDNITVIVARVSEHVAPEIPHADLPKEESDAVAPRRNYSAVLWVAAGGCLAALGYCLAYAIWAGAVAAGIVFAAMVAGAVAQQSGPGRARSTVPLLGGPYGNGPYRKRDCPPNGHVVAALGEFVERLRELPEIEPGEWTVDWQPFDEQRAQAAIAARKGDHVAAVRSYSEAIRNIMRQLREHRPTVEHDTNTF